MQNILNEKKSDIGSPYVFYTINAEYKNRTVNSVDIDVEYISHLQYSSSSLKSGTLTGYIKINGQERSVTLKSSGDSWNGTTRHYSHGSYTIDVNPQDTSLEVTFRVVRGGGSSGTLNEISCDSISIPIGHTPPSDVAFTMTETNQKLLDIGINNNLFVENLSIKSFNITGTTHDGATIKSYSIYNRITPYPSPTLPIIIDFRSVELYKDNTYTNKIPIRARLLDSLDTAGFSEIILYDYIPYKKVNLIETSTTAKRNGQTSGKVVLNVNGNFYNGILGNIDQTNYKPIIKYKFWKLNETEPTTFDNVIPQDDITIQNNTFIVSNYEIGTVNETESNYFNPNFAYRIKVYVEDNFTEYVSTEKPIPIGEATWTEYKDRVDFKNITKQGLEIFTPKVLYDNSDGSHETITLSETTANFDYLEIFYKNNDNRSGSLRVDNPNNKIVSLYCFYPNSTPYVWEQYADCTISEDKITRNVTLLKRTSNGKVDYLETSDSVLFITKVLGYK